MYGGIMEIRNWAFNKGLLSSYSSKIKTISVGNLSVGGSGKTPCSIYLIEHLQEQGFKPAFVSRGYGRSTKGLKEVKLNQDMSFFGDEPYLVKEKFPNLPVWVSEKRKIAIQELEKNPDIDIIILDDAFQHRYVNRDLNILLSRFDYPYFYDQVVPGGRLREFRKQAKRADYTIFTKCPIELSPEEMAYYNLESRNYSSAPVGFAFTKQKGITSWEGVEIPINNQKVALVTGIAQPNLLVEYVNNKFELLEHFEYNDHQNYDFADVQKWLQFRKDNGLDFILLTEKDAARLKDVIREIERPYFAVLPMKIDFHPNTKSHLELLLKELME